MQCDGSAPTFLLGKSELRRIRNGIYQRKKKKKRKEKKRKALPVAGTDHLRHMISRGSDVGYRGFYYCRLIGTVVNPMQLVIAYTSD